MADLVPDCDEHEVPEIFGASLTSFIIIRSLSFPKQRWFVQMSIYQVNETVHGLYWGSFLHMCIYTTGLKFRLVRDSPEGQK